MSDFVIEIIPQAPIQVVPQPTVVEVTQIGAQGPPGTGLAEHLADANPHPQYVDGVELGEAIASITPASIGADLSGTAASTIAAHENAPDPHPQYMTSAEVEALLGGSSFAPAIHQHAIADVSGLQAALDGKEAVGAATQAIASHVALADPHSQYSTTAEVQALIADHEAETDPHPQYTSNAELNAAIATITPAYIGAEPAGTAATAITAHENATDPHPQYTTSTELNAAIASIPPAPVQSVFGRTGNVVSQSGDYNSDQITEGSTNLFITAERSRSYLSATTPLSYNSSLGVFSLPAASASQDGYFSSANFTKLAGIQSGATANSTDAFLLSRTNHTGTQSVSTITGLGTAATLNNTTATWNANQLQGRAIATTEPTNLQALRWNSTSQQWEPQTTTVTSANITDSTATGRSVLAATDAAAARTAIGAPAKPATSTLNAIARYSNTTGDLANSAVTIGDTGTLTTKDIQLTGTVRGDKATAFGGIFLQDINGGAGVDIPAPTNAGFTTRISIDQPNWRIAFISNSTFSINANAGNAALPYLENTWANSSLNIKTPVGLSLGTTVFAPATRLHVNGGLLVANSTSGTDPGTGNAAIAGTLRIGSYTTATLPAAGTAGRLAYATDARWSGGIGCEVRDNGSIWLTPDGVQASTTGYHRTLTANRTLDRTDRIIWANTAGIAITLPAVSTNKYVPYRIRNLSAGAITIAVTGTDTVESVASISLAAGNSYDLENDGSSAWRFV